MLLRKLSGLSRSRYINLAVLSYVGFALAWISSSDQFLALFTDSSGIVRLSTAKGFAFVAVTAVLFYLALHFLPSEANQQETSRLLSGSETPLRWPRWSAYLFAIACSFCLLWFRLSLPIAPETRPLITLFVLPIILSAALGGIGPGLLATALATINVCFFVTVPLYTLRINNPEDQLQLGFLVLTGVIVSLLAEILHRTLRRLETASVLQALTLSSAGDAIITTDREGMITLLNPAAERLTGWSQARAIGQPLRVLEILEAPTSCAISEVVQRVLGIDQAPLLDQEATLRKPDGAERLLDMSVAPICLPDGGIVGAILTFRDVTARRQAEETLRQSEARYTRVIEGSNQGFWEWNLKTKTFTTSARFESMLGFAYGERSFAIEQWPEIVHPEDMPKALASIEKHIKGETPAHHAEIRCRTKNNEWKWVLTHGRIVEYDEDGAPLVMAGTHTDISERKMAETALQQAAIVFESTQEGVIITDSETRIIMVNAAFTRLTGYSKTDVIGKKPSLLNSGRTSQACYAAMWNDLNSLGYWQGELVDRSKNGEIFSVLSSINTVKDDSGSVTNYVSVFMDISTLKASEEELHFLANHDSLTKLPNRRLLFSQLEHGLAKIRRDGGTLGLLIFDLDRFKDVNDSFGHLIGDQLLQQVAARLSERLRSSDTIARLGGDEFTVLLGDLSRPEDAARVAEEIIETLNQAFRLPNGVDIRTSASIGISFSTGSEITAETLLQQADAAMYRAKEAGRGRFQYYSENMTIAARERVDIDNRLRQAIKHNEFRVYYQPQVDIVSGRIVGAEALVRWQDANEGLIPPSRFIPVAEETGMIRDIGEWVLRETCRQGRAWSDAGLPPIVLAVNISAHQIRHGNLIETVDRILGETGFSPRFLELELTESALMEKTNEVSTLLNDLRARQIRLAIDDFGTGYSSLAYLKRFPLDILKIDKSFIDDISHDQDDREIIKAVIEMGHALGIKVLAEGVESGEQLAFLQAQGCDAYQGYFCSKPVPADVFSRLLSR